MATCRTRNPNATAAPRRVPAPLQGASGAAPPLLRSADEGKRSRRSALTGTWRPLRASDGFGHLKGLGFLFRRATRLLSGA